MSPLRPERSEQSVAYALDVTSEQASSHAELAEKVRRLTFVASASSEMLVRDEPREVLAGVYELLRAELGLDCCFNYLVEEESIRLRLNFVAGVSAEQERSLEWLDFGQAVCGEVAVRRAEIVREAVQEADDPMVALIRSLGIKAYICVPLMAGERLVGTFSVGTRGRTRFTSDDVALLRSIAVPLAFTLERRQLIRTLKQLRLRADRLQSLASALSQSATPLEVANAVIEHCTAMFGGVGTVITRLTPDANSLELLGARAMPGELREEWAQFPVDADVPLAEVVRTGQLIAIESPDEWTRRYPALAGMLEASGQHSLVVVPLVIESRTIGSMGVAFDQPRLFTQDDRKLILILAQQCAQALERARLLEAEQLARRSAESADREKAELLASVSHDLRTPLNAIGGYVQLLQMGLRGELSDAQREDLARISRNQSHLLHLVEELLRFSALTSSARPRKLVRVPLAEAIQAAQESVLPQAEMKSISLRVPEDRDDAVQGDPERIQQIIINILANAVKFTPAGGSVTLSSDVPTPAEVCLRIKDSGPGIPADMQSRIFEPFRQLTESSSEGVGLGLAISRTLARASGGDVIVESEPGDGATFIVRLPRAR